MSAEMVGADILEECGLNWLANAMRTDTLPPWLAEWLANGPGKLYLVNSGEYSDWRVDGVFASEQLANEYMDSYRKARSEDEYWSDDFNGLDEVELNAGFQPGLIMFRVQMEFDDTTRDAARSDSKHPSAYPIGPHRGTDNRKLFIVECWATDVNHAVKIANEKRIVFLHEREMGLA